MIATLPTGTLTGTVTEAIAVSTNVVELTLAGFAGILDVRRTDAESVQLGDIVTWDRATRTLTVAPTSGCAGCDWADPDPTEHTDACRAEWDAAELRAFDNALAVASREPIIGTCAGCGEPLFSDSDAGSPDHDNARLYHVECFPDD